MYSISLLLVAIFCFSWAKALAGSQNGIMKIRLSPTSGRTNSSDLKIPFKDCGYIFCEAPDVALDETTHYWDYYVDWEMPPLANQDPKVFVLANDFQMPRSYLVFREFSANLTGEYQCILHFRKKPIASHTLNISLSDAVATKNCMGNNP